VLGTIAAVSVELWQFRFSHFNEKARWTLDFKGIPHTRRTFVPGFHIPTLLLRTGQPLTPVVRTAEGSVCDSTAILAWAEQRQPQPSLWPLDPGERTQAEALEDWFDEEVGSPVRRLVYDCLLTDREACTAFSTTGESEVTASWFRRAMPLLDRVIRWNMQIRAELVSAARVAVARAFDRIEAEVGSSGYLVGDRFSAADLTAAALLSNLVRPDEYPYPWTNMPPVFHDLVEPYAQRDGARWVRRMYRDHRGTVGG
jgi:glutathione S-transferase